MNSKAAAANERKAAADAEKNRKKSADTERKEAAEWSKGGDARAAKKREEEELRRQEADARKAELKRLQEQDEEILQGIKPKGKTKAQKNVDKPWELALQPAAKKGNRGNRSSAAKSSSTTTAAYTAPPPAPKPLGRGDIVFDDEVRENRNRLKTDALEGM